jgi:hypothetical protein
MRIKLKKAGIHPDEPDELEVATLDEERIKSNINGPKMWFNSSYLMHTSSPPSKQRRRLAWADIHIGVPGFLHNESDRCLTSRLDATSAH